jgi:UDP-N-acetylmuramoyl-tripeptide--D-alanyl-D-alanine ligase
MMQHALPPIWTAAEIAKATGGRASHDFTVSLVDIDSRAVTQGSLFVALKGAASDGHKYIASAFDLGAAGVLIHDPSALDRADRPHVLVGDTMAALEALANQRRAEITGTVFGITGSAGKTGSKEALRLSFERELPRQVHASVLSYNNHTGVPLSIARCPADVRVCVLEMGMNHAGELTHLSSIARPHIAIITTVASAHREFFKTEEDIADAKAEIFSGLVPGGTAIINRDNRHYARLRATAEKSPAGRIITFGKDHDDADVRALKVARYDNGSGITADVMGDILTYKISQAGDHWVMNSLAVLAAVKAADGDLGLAGLALAEMDGIAGRGRRVTIKTKDGGDALILDEAYNANPASMAAALDVLGSITPKARGRRIAVLADMKELGVESAPFHRALAEPIQKAGVQLLFTLGAEIGVLSDVLPHQRMDSLGALQEALTTGLRDGDVVLVKGSNSMKLGSVISALSARGGD